MSALENLFIDDALTQITAKGQNLHFTESLLTPHCSLINFRLGTHIDCLEDNVFREIFGLVNVRFFQ